MSIGDRFQVLRDLLGKNHASGRELSQSEAAALIGVNRDSWRRYEGGDVPNGQAISRLSALGISIDWLLTGQGSMMVGEQAVPVETRAEPESAPPRELDDELMARVVDTIARAYKDAGVTLAPMDLGRLASLHYRRVSRTNVSGTPLNWDETLAMLRFLRISIMDELQKGGSANDSKAQGSAS